jgi:hypothetical protein
VSRSKGICYFSPLFREFSVTVDSEIYESMTTLGDTQLSESTNHDRIVYSPHILALEVSNAENCAESGRQLH